MIKTELCAYSVEACRIASNLGVNRVELCASPAEGGVTPSLATIERVSEIAGLDVSVMIRPRGGDFLYSDEEFQIMLRDIEHARQAGATGVVFGILTADGKVDIERTRQLVEAARGMESTFPRAVDMTADYEQAIRDIIAAGCTRILTSGCRPTAAEGTPLLAQLIEKAAGRIIIMPGCGVNENNIAEIARLSGAREFHFSARESVESGMIFRNPQVAMGSEDDPYGTVQTTARRVAATIAPLKS